MARFLPKREANAPGASGAFGAKLAVLTTPALLMTGTAWLVSSVPLSWSLPVRAGCELCAVTVITTGAEAAANRGRQVADHFPDPSEVSASDGSRVENEATLSPAP